MRGYPPQGLFTPPRTATIYIVAYNASTLEKAQADYICDGVADEVEINIAILALSATGGRIQLSTGTFNISDTILFNLQKRYIFVGQGIATDLIQSAGAVNSIIKIHKPGLAALDLIANMRVNGNSTAVTPAIHLSQNCPDVWMDRMWVTGNAGPSIQIDAGWDHVFTNMIIEDNDGYGIYQTSGAGGLGGPGGVISNTSIYSNKQALHFEYSTERWLIVNSRLLNTDEHAVWLESSRLVEFSNCIIGSAGYKSATNDTYDDIHITTDGVHSFGSVLVTGGSVGGFLGGANLPKYGINVDRNGVDLASSGLGVSNVKFYDTGTNQIKLDTTMDMRNVSIVGITGSGTSNAKWNILSTGQYKEIVLRTDSLTEAVVDTGTTALYSDGMVRLGTGANANSSAQRYSSVLVGLSHQGYTIGTLDLPHNPLYIKFDICRQLGGDNPVGYVHLKAGTAIDDLAALGLGLKISALNLYAETHDGADRTETLLLALTSGRLTQVEILYVYNALYFIIDHIIYLIQTDDLPANNIVDPQFSIAISTVNAGNALLYVGQVRIKRMELYP